MDPFANSNGSMELIHLRGQVDKYKALVASLEKELQSRPRVGEAAAPAAAPIPAAPVVAARPTPAVDDSALRSKIEALERQNAELSQQLAAISIDEQERDAQWRNALSTVKRRYSARLQQTAASPAPPPVAPAAAAAAAPLRASPVPLPTPPRSADPAAEQWGPQLIQLVMSLKNDMCALSDRVDAISRSGLAPATVEYSTPGASVAGATRPPQTRTTKPEPKPDSLHDRLQDAFTKAQTKAATGKDTRTYARSPKDSTVVDGSETGTTTGKKRGRPAKSQQEKTTGTSGVLAGGDHLSDGTKPHLNKTSRSEMEERNAAHQRLILGGDYDLIGEYLKAVSGSSRDEFDRIARRFVKDAEDIAAVKHVPSGVLLARKLLFTIRKHASSWRAAKRADTTRSTMVRALDSLAFRTTFIQIAFEEIEGYMRHLCDDSGTSNSASRLVDHPDVVFEVAACAGVWIAGSDATMIAIKMFDILMNLVKGLRRVTQTDRRLDVTAASLAAFDGLSRSHDVRETVAARRASLVGLAMHLTLASVVADAMASVGDDEAGAAITAHWESICRAFTWTRQAPTLLRDMVLERARTVCTTKSTFEAGWDAVMALRVLFQSFPNGVTQFYEVACAECAAPRPAPLPTVALLIATCSMDFGLQYQPTDLALAVYLASILKHSNDAEPAVQLAAGAALITCCPVPSKSKDPFVEHFVAGADTIRQLFERQKTVHGLRPLMAATMSKDLSARVLAFIALPKA